MTWSLLDPLAQISCLRSPLIRLTRIKLPRLIPSWMVSCPISTSKAHWDCVSVVSIRRPTTNVSCAVTASLHWQRTNSSAVNVQSLLCAKMASISYLTQGTGGRTSHRFQFSNATTRTLVWAATTQLVPTGTVVTSAIVASSKMMSGTHVKLTMIVSPVCPIQLIHGGLPVLHCSLFAISWPLSMWTSVPTPKVNNVSQPFTCVF